MMIDFQSSESVAATTMTFSGPPFNLDLLHGRPAQLAFTLMVPSFNPLPLQSFTLLKSRVAAHFFILLGNQMAMPATAKDLQMRINSALRLHKYDS